MGKGCVRFKKLEDLALDVVGRTVARVPVVAHKTGTGGTRDSITSATNDIGIITLPNGTHLAVAVFVSDSSADEATRESVIARIAKAAWDWASSAQQPATK